MTPLRIVIGFIFTVLICPPAFNQQVTLLIPSFKNNRHLYYHALIREALTQQGHDVEIKEVFDKEQAWIMAALRRSAISLYWMLPTAERDEQLVPINVPLTNGLIGQRVLLIPQGTQSVYDNVHNLNEFRALDKYAALGSQWFETAVWAHNRLTYRQVEDWQRIMQMLSSGIRGLDYFPLSVVEVNDNLAKFPQIEIERNLLLAFEGDFRFYLSNEYQWLKPDLERALSIARQSGLMEALIEQYWSEKINNLHLQHRRTITLDLPPYKSTQ